MMQKDLSRAFLDQAASHLEDDFLPKIESATSNLTTDQIWWRPNQSSNSIGNLILHLCGNVRQWILAGIGRQPDHRDRDHEFNLRQGDAAPELLTQLEKTVAEAVQFLRTVTPEDLQALYRIQIYDVTGLQSVFHVVEHFSYHTGQILYITKLLTDRDLGFYSQLDAD